jgi:protocatechuate 3,4-dioxygenase beta subunit
MKPPFLMLVLIVLSVFSVHAQNAAVPQEKCTIAGTVIDAVSEQPLTKAEVRLRRAPGPLETASQPASQSVLQSLSASTDASGRFVFDGLSAGRYVLLASHDGYVTGRENSRLRGQMLSLTSGQHISDVVLRLLPGGVIAGHITNEAGKALRGVSVQAMKSSYPRGRRELHDVAHITTNEAGEYRIPGLAPGKYYIRAKAPGSLKAKPGSDKAYVPLFYPAASDQARSIALVVRAGEDLAGVDMNFVPVHAVHIRGRVINSRTSLPSKEAEVTLLSDQGETIFSPGQDFSVGTQATFEFQGVPPGSYVLVAQQPGNPQEPKTMWGRTSIEVGDTNLEHVEVVVSPGVDFSGRIRVEGKTDLDTSKEDLSKDMSKLVGILAPQEASSLAGLMPDIDNAPVKPDGSFIFREVPEGTYRLNFFPIPAGFYLKSSGTADVLETGLTVGRGHSPPPMELVLSSGAARIDGTVESEQQSLPGASVVLVPDGKQRAQPSNFRQAVTDQLGRFAMRNIAPGDYTLFAWEQIESGAYMDPDFLGQYEDRGKAVHIEEGGHSTVQLEVIPATETVP